MFYFDPKGDVQYVTNGSQVTSESGYIYFKNSGYNADIAPNKSITFGYAVENCEAIPEDFTLCQKRTEKESGYQVLLKVNQTWGDSFNGEIIIQNNTAEPIEAWELMVDTNFTITEITNSWAATVTELGSYRYMLKGTYTSTIYPNSSVSLGFNGVKSGDPIVTDYSLTEVVVDEEIVYNASINKDYTIPELEELNKDTLRFTDEEMKIVTDAYDEIWGKDNRKYTFTVNVHDFEDNDIELKNVSITLKNRNDTVSLENKKAKVVEPGWYDVSVKADGYITYNYKLYKGTADDGAYITLVKDVPNNGQVIVRVTDHINDMPVDEPVKLFTMDENFN
ncbi:MAG: cellulose binding domain-containing protein [Clostridium sp.]|nr:cellulose binding domain-containing protein [Clostridium sp.]